MRSSYKLLKQPMWHLLPLSGSSENALQKKYVALTQHIQQFPNTPLYQIASLLNQENVEGTFRKAVIVNDSHQLVKQFASSITKDISQTNRSLSPIIFMFPGIGDHYLQMGRGLYEAIPFFREVIDRCDAELRPFLAESLVELLYPPELTKPKIDTPSTGFDLAAMLERKKTSKMGDPQEAHLRETTIAHPLVFSIEYALAKLLQRWGIHPDGLIGYSLGEYVAATISGVLSLEDALTLVARRAQSIQNLPPGKMLIVPLTKEAVKPYLNKNISLSAHNGESLTILAGETEAVRTIHQQLLEQQVACRILETNHAFHSHMMEEASIELTDLARSISYSPPQIPYFSNVTGNWITTQQATDPTYWAQHMCQPVQYFTMLRNLLGTGQTYHLIEVGPGQSLGSFAKQHPQCKREQYASIYPTLRYSYDHQDDHYFLLDTIRKLWLSGIDLHWEKISHACSDSNSETRERPLILTTTQINSQRPLQQKVRGKKRRQNRLHRRNNKNNNGQR